MPDVPKFVLKRLKETAGVESHPDADLLTAFAEQSLLESERARVIEHLSRCGECREVVALALPASEDVAVTVSLRTARGSWSGWPILRWSLAIVGLVALTSVGILQYRQRHQTNQTLNAVLTAQNQKPAAPELANQQPPTSFQLQEIPPQTKSTAPPEARKKAQSIPQDTSAKDKSTRWLREPYPASGVSRAVGSGTGAGISGGSADGRAPAAAAPAPSPSVPQQAVVSSPSETVQVDSQAAAAVTTTESQVSDQLVQDQKERPSKDVSSINTILDAVKASPRWSISSKGALQRSLDAGNTWVEINIDSELTASRSRLAGIAGNTKEVSNANKKVKAQQSLSASFRALTAFGTEVWAGGSAAMLYHSGDSGAHWTRVLPSSSGVPLTGNVTSIEFSDPRHGTITTSSGERWITPDAGQTWSRQ